MKSLQSSKNCFIFHFDETSSHNQQMLRKIIKLGSKILFHKVFDWENAVPDVSHSTSFHSWIFPSPNLHPSPTSPICSHQHISCFSHRQTLSRPIWRPDLRNFARTARVPALEAAPGEGKRRERKLDLQKSRRRKLRRAVFIMQSSFTAYTLSAIERLQNNGSWFFASNRLIGIFSG